MTVQPGYESLTFYYGANELLYPGQADEEQLVAEFGYVAALADFSPGLAFTIKDVTTGETISFGDSPERTMVDLSRWESVHTVDLTISATRLRHELEIHTATGQTFPIAQGQVQGVHPIGSPLDLQGYTVSWSFGAIGMAPSSPARRWWVYDKTTHERSDDFAYSLTGWGAPNHTADLDGDGLPDWFEHRTPAGTIQSEHHAPTTERWVALALLPEGAALLALRDRAAWRRSVVRIIPRMAI